MLRGPWPVLAAALTMGAPTPALAASTDDAARDYVGAHASQFGVSPADVADLGVQSSYMTSGTGVTHVNLTQRRDGFDVFDSSVTVNIGRDGRVVFAAGSLVKGLRAGATPATLDATEAVAAAAQALGLDEPDALKVTRGSAKAGSSVMSGGGISASPIPAKLGWQPAGDGTLRLAWRLEIDAASDAHLWDATVDARTGALLDSEDLMIHDNADDLAALARRPISPNFAPPAFVLKTPDPVNEGSSYRVLAYPTESFNDADRTVVTNPADRPGSPFGWHDTNGAAGSEFTTTPGNNAHAYMDQDNNNAPDFNSSPDGGASLTFDFPLDPTEHAQTYRSAATTNLFYANNMIHDLLHRYGFNEASGNFQANN
jgi:Zn-dependent metalloprotease